MAKVLALSIPDEVDEAFFQAAARSGVSVEEWAIRQLRRAVLTADDYAEALARLLCHAGTMDRNQPDSADNTRIDTESFVLKRFDSLGGDLG